MNLVFVSLFFFSSRRRHTRWPRDWSSDVCSSDLGPVPGAPGDAVMDGHAGYPGQPLIFGRLAKIQPGEPIWVVLADGSKQVFTVSWVQSCPATSVPPPMFEPYGPPRLTLVTCDGQFNSDNKTYASRLVVEASYEGVGARAGCRRGGAQ